MTGVSGIRVARADGLGQLARNDHKLMKVLKTAALGMLGLVLMASSVGECDAQAGYELAVRAQKHSAPVWSKDGSHIIFSHPPSGVFVVQADGSGMWSLPPNSPVGTLKSPGNFSPALSPDGSRVAYAMVVTRDDTSAIVTSALDGSDLHRLTSNKAVDAYPAWSPDGTQILFYSDRAGSPGNPALSLFIMDSDGANLRELGAESSKPISNYPPVWSPDGQRIAFVVGDYEGRDFVQTIRPDGSGLTELGETASSPAWSPDGTRIAFIREGTETRGLYTMDPDGGNQRLLWSFERDGRYWYDNLAWSPDGTEILYGVSDARTSFSTPVVVVGVDGSEPRVLGKHGAAWSPDGSRIAFHVTSNNSGVVLYTTARDGSDKRVLVRGSYERLVAEHSDWRDVSGDVAACSGGYVAPKPDRNPGLVQDCETLLRLREALAGDAVLNWSADVQMSEWGGVGIEGSPPRVIRLSLSRLRPVKLTGIIPPELGNLANLEVLSLHSNQLSGSIPPELGNLANLRDLRLSSNALEGTIPAELGRLASLERMILARNRLVGGIPSELGNLSNLNELWLNNNNLTGCVPAVLSGHLETLVADGLEYC